MGTGGGQVEGRSRGGGGRERGSSALTYRARSHGASEMAHTTVHVHLHTYTPTHTHTHTYTQGGAVEQHGDVLERRTACSALAGLLAYAELMADGSSSGSGGGGGSSSGGRYSLSLFNAGSYMRLDATAQRALNVLPSRQVGEAVCVYRDVCVCVYIGVRV